MFVLNRGAYILMIMMNWAVVLMFIRRCGAALIVMMTRAVVLIFVMN